MFAAPIAATRTKVAAGSRNDQQTRSALMRQVLAAPGRPLDAPSRAHFEPLFHFDFSSVRIHDDALAAKSASSVRAAAYTVGPHIVFGEGRPAAGSRTERRMMAHELAHVAQWRKAGAPHIATPGPVGAPTPRRNAKPKPPRTALMPEPMCPFRKASEAASTGSRRPAP